MKDLDQWLLVMRDASLAGDTAALLALRSSLASQVGASEVGMDSCGLWARFVVGTVDYPMRWVPPGTFLMGASPEAGPNYDPDATENDGPVREVTLTPEEGSLSVRAFAERGSSREGLSRPRPALPFSSAEEPSAEGSPPISCS